jgi:putative SOS response-associated peptidase YedK
MCGRTSLFVDLATLETRLGARFATDGGRSEYRPRYNVAPREDLAVVTGDAPDRIETFRWGLVPEWGDADDEGFINARAETAAEKPSFRDAWADRPCLVPSTGFYEWRDRGRGPKQPYRIYRDREGAEAVFAMAGVWSPRPGADDPAGTGEPGSRRGTVTILTTEPNDTVAPIHDRMPVVLPRRAERTWLTAGPDERRDLCEPYPDDDLEAYPVSRRVNDPGNDDPSVIEPDETEQSGLGQFG